MGTHTPQDSTAANPRETLRIGQVAQRAGVSVDTVRFYERRGVLPPPARRASGYRSYTNTAVERIQFVRALQGLGFTLDEIIDVLNAVDAGTATCANQVHRFKAVVTRIDDKIAELQAVREQTIRAAGGCRSSSCALNTKAAAARMG